MKSNTATTEVGVQAERTSLWKRILKVLETLPFEAEMMEGDMGWYSLDTNSSEAEPTARDQALFEQFVTSRRI